MTESRVSNYVVHGRARVSGWFSRFDAETIATIMLDQNRREVMGDALEMEFIMVKRLFYSAYVYVTAKRVLRLMCLKIKN